MTRSNRTLAPARGAARPARRARPAFWADARFVIGVVLVAASIAGVWFVVAAARQTVPVLTATTTLVPGQTITSADVAVVEVALGQALPAYLAADQLGQGEVALRTIEAGELVPRAGVGDASLSDRTAVVVRSSIDVPADVERGATVELWESRPAGAPGAFDPPRVLVADAVVADVIEEEGVMASGGAALELVIDRRRVAEVLGAIAAGSVLSAVPNAGAAATAPASTPASEAPAGEGDE